MNWSPFTLDEVNRLLQRNTGWFIDGGTSLDLFLGYKSRNHEDLDIGVFSSEIEAVLEKIEFAGFEVYVANRDLVAYDSNNFIASDYNYWVSDGEQYKLQILVYKQNGDNIIFRRNPTVSWPISRMILKINDLPVIHPLVTYAFKVTTCEPQEKDLQDIAVLMQKMASCKPE